MEVLAEKFDMRYNADRKQKGRPSQVMLKYVEGPLPEEIMADLEDDAEDHMSPASGNFLQRNCERSGPNLDVVRAASSEMKKQRGSKARASRKAQTGGHGGPQNQQDGDATSPKRPVTKLQRRGSLGVAPSTSPFVLE